MNNINLEDIFIKCVEYSKKIRNIDLRDCCQKILRDYKEKLIKKPATTGAHHYFEGGLLYHKKANFVKIRFSVFSMVC